MMTTEEARIKIESIMNIDDLNKDTREISYVFARKMFCHYLRRHKLLTWYKIGAEINRSYCNAIHLDKSLSNLLEYDKPSRELWNKFMGIEEEEEEAIEEIKHRYYLRGLEALLHLNDSDMLEFKETRLKPFLMMLESRKKSKQIQEVAGAMLNR